MKVKMKVDLKGAAGNGETTIMYNAGQTYEMKTKLEMEMAGAWLNDGRAEKDTGEKSTKVVNDMEKKESKVKKAIKKVLGTKKK